MNCIKSDIISGRSAIYCISEMRYFLTLKFNDLDEIDAQKVTFLQNLVYNCLNPFLSTSNFNNGHCAVFLELIPIVFSYLVPKNSSNYFTTYHKPLIKLLLKSSWQHNSLVLLFNLMSEIYFYFTPKNIRKIQVKM